MSPSEHDLRCEEAREILEPYLDGDLSAAEASRLGEHLERCPSCAAALELATRIQRELRNLPGFGEVVPFRARHRATGLRLAAAAAMLSLIVGGGALFLHLQRRTDRPSPAEIAQATQEARLALAYFGKVTRRASLDLRDEVLEKRLVAPATRSVSRSLGEIPESVSGQSAKEF
jgi:anti-sigma factor RsiW